MWETSKGLEDGGGIKRLRNEDRSDEKRVSVTDAPLTEPTAWQAALCLTERQEVELSCGLQVQTKATRDELHDGSSNIPLHNEWECDFTLNAAAGLTAVLCAVMTGNHWEAILDVLIRRALTATSLCFWWQVKSSHPAPAARALFPLRVSVSQEMEILVRREEKRNPKMSLWPFLLSLVSLRLVAHLLLVRRRLSNQLFFSPARLSPLFFTPVYSPLLAIPFPFSFIFSTVSPTAPLLFRLHPSSPLIFCLLLHLPSSSLQLIFPRALIFPPFSLHSKENCV